MPVAATIGRIPCGLAGMDYGTATSLAWGVIYTHPASYAPNDGVARHPVYGQFYELAGDLVIAAVLLRNHPGLFAFAHGGTLLLDEIGDLSKGGRRSCSVCCRGGDSGGGSVEHLAVDVRINAATNRSRRELKARAYHTAARMANVVRVS